MRLTVFHRRGERERFAGLLDRLRTENPHIAYELFDLDRYPERARADGITQYGRAAIEYQGRRVVTPAEPEEQLAGGILQAVRGRRRRAVLTTGTASACRAASAPAAWGASLPSSTRRASPSTS